MKFLMCDPHFFRVSYEINPWMKVENQPSNSLAIEQWNRLVELLISLGATVEVMQGKELVPDIVFTANAALMHKNTAYISNFYYPERRPETQFYEFWFRQNGFDTIYIDNYFEGAGDALFSYQDDGHLYLGHGFRSSLGVLPLNGIVPLAIHTMHLIDPRFYHLDTCFCPLKDSFNLVYLPAFSSTTRNAIMDNMKYINVCEEDAQKFACNSICLGNKVVMPSGCENTYKQIESLGYEVYHTDVSEFIKAGGACKCLTLRLDEFCV